MYYHILSIFANFIHELITMVYIIDLRVKYDFYIVQKTGVFLYIDKVEQYDCLFRKTNIQFSPISNEL